MQIVLTEPQEEFVKQAVNEGRYTSESEVVNFGIRLVQARDETLAALRSKLSASMDAGGAHTSDEMEAHMEAQLGRLREHGIPG